MVTEEQYKEALKICKLYIDQLKSGVNTIESEVESVAVMDFTSIWDIDGLSVRAQNILRWGLKKDKLSDEEFCKTLTIKTLTSIKNCGYKTAHEIANALAKYGIFIN